MAVDITEVFRRGGKGLIDLLEYCVYSVQMDPVFVFLAGEYRTFPAAAKAVALYENFCAPDAPARVSEWSALPPYDLNLAAVIRLLEERQRLTQARPPGQEEEEARSTPPPVIPDRYLFDPLARTLEESPRGSFKRVGVTFDASLGPLGNLPGGRMTQGQQVFVERVWELRVRPRLVAAGFRRIANIA